jgi:hypothetical protein
MVAGISPQRACVFSAVRGAERLEHQPRSAFFRRHAAHLDRDIARPRQLRRVLAPQHDPLQVPLETQHTHLPDVGAQKVGRERGARRLRFRSTPWQSHHQGQGKKPRRRRPFMLRGAYAPSRTIVLCAVRHPERFPPWTPAGKDAPGVRA